MSLLLKEKAYPVPSKTLKYKVGDLETETDTCT